MVIERYRARQSRVDQSRRKAYTRRNEHDLLLGSLLRDVQRHELRQKGQEQLEEEGMERRTLWTSALVCG